MSEHEDLSNLLKSPGWLRVGEYARVHITEHLTQHIASAANDRDDVMALNKLRQVIAAQKAVEQLLAWPGERIRHLEQQTAVAHGGMSSLSRRGGL